MMLDDAQLRAVLKESKSIAVYGMSRNREKAAHSVPAYLASVGFEIIPVNPYADEILGRPCYQNLSDIPDAIDIVEVFRPSEEALDVVKEALDRRETKGDVNLIWLQLGIRNEAARELCQKANVPFVQNRCMAVEVPRLLPNIQK